jgi:hypothetical protein
MNIHESHLRFADGKGQHSQTYSATRFSPDGTKVLPICLSCTGNIQITVDGCETPVSLTGNALLSTYTEEYEALKVLIAHSRVSHRDAPIIASDNISDEESFTLQRAALIFKQPEVKKPTEEPVTPKTQDTA